MFMEAMMIKAVRIALLSSALICGTAGVALAQWYPLWPDPNATYKIPGTDEFFTGSGQRVINSYPDVQKKMPPAATQKAPRPAAVQQTAPLGS
jgi:hypothetical protein